MALGCGLLSAATDESAEPFSLQLQSSDEAGMPIVDAKVDLVGFYQRPSIIHATPGRVPLTHKGEGRYEAVGREQAQPLLYDASALLVVQAPGRKMQFQTHSLRRIRSNVPLQLTLHPSTDQAIHVVDSLGEPIKGVLLSPAIWDRTVIPLFDEVPKSEPSTEAGMVEAPWIDSSRLTMVYAFGDSIGNQRLPISVADDGSLQVVAMPTFEVPGQWSSSIDMNAHPSFFETPITVMVRSEKLSYSEQSLSPYTWANLTPQPDGSLSASRLARGEMVLQADLSNSIPLVTSFETRTLEPGDSIRIGFVEGIRVRGSIVDEQAGNPLAGIALRQFTASRIAPVTGADGSFELLFPPGERIGYYPADVTGKYTAGGAFYLYPQELPVDGKLNLEPTRLLTTSSALGKVVDQQGNGVGGARIECQYQNERFTENVILFSNRDGSFRFHAIHENGAVRLTAMTDSMMTRQPVSVQLSPEAKVELIVHPRHAIRVRGRITDWQGHPIVNAVATIRTPQVNEQESYGGEDASAVPLLDSGHAIITDADGRFLSPPIIDWDRRLSLEIRAGGWRTLQTYWTDAAPFGKAKSDFDAGTLKMLPNWKTITQRIEVVDAQSGQPLPDSRVVCQGAYVTQQRSKTDTQGVAEFRLRDSTAVFAVVHQGYHPAFKVRQAGQSLDRIELRSLALPQTVPEAVVLAPQQRKELAAKLMQRVSKPSAQESPHRLGAYYRSLAFADFDAMLADAKVFAALPGGKEKVAQLYLSINRFSSDEMKQVADFIDPGQKLQLLTIQVDQTSSTDEKLELLGEAMILAQQMTGDMALLAIATVAGKLFEIGEDDTAKQLLQDAYNDHEKLTLIREKGERQKEPGIARIYLPLYAVVDASVAIKLIELTAFPQEVARLQTMAVRFAVEYGDQDLQVLCQQNGIQQLSSFGMSGHYVNVKHRSVARGMALASLCPDEPSKGDFLFELARTSDADRERKVQLAQASLEIMRSESAEPSIFTPSHWLAERVAEVSTWDHRLAQEYLFEALWTQSEVHRITAFHQTATLAQHTAKADVAIARALIEPCFDDWSWLFGELDASVMFTDIPPLKAAAAIDPDWTVTLIDDVFKKHLEDHDSRKLEMLHGVVTSLTE